MKVDKLQNFIIDINNQYKKIGKKLKVSLTLSCALIDLDESIDELNSNFEKCESERDLYNLFRIDSYSFSPYSSNWARLADGTNRVLSIIDESIKVTSEHINNLHKCRDILSELEPYNEYAYERFNQYLIESELNMYEKLDDEINVHVRYKNKICKLRGVVNSLYEVCCNFEEYMYAQYELIEQGD